MTRNRTAPIAAASALATALALAACTAAHPDAPASAPATTPASSPAGASSARAGSSTAPGIPPVPSAISSIMKKAVYAKATWSLLAVDLNTGQPLVSVHSNKLAFTGSTRKLFSVGLALDELGSGHTTTTGVYRSGSVDAAGVLHGNVDFVGAGDLTLGGRRTAANTLAYTDFDHNDGNNLGTAILTPQNPLAGLNALAASIKAAGITRIDGNVVIDDRLFPAYRVPNQQLLISPTMLNENMVDVTVTPTRPGQPAKIDYRPRTSGFRVTGTVRTTTAATKATVSIPEGKTPANTSVTGVINCVGRPKCTGTISGTIPVGYKAPLSGRPQFVGTFRIDNPANFARSAFIDALERHGIAVSANAVGPNPSALLPKSTGYPRTDRLATYVSPSYAQQAKLILKVSLNLGANLALTQIGLAHGQKTVTGALAAERRGLIGLGIPGPSFAFPTNGSGSPDSKATPEAIVDMLTAMTKTRVAADYRTALPVLGVNGSLAGTGTDLPAKGHVYGKTGTTVGEGGDLVAENLAGYIDARNGHRIAFAFILNDYGKLTGLEDVIKVLSDEAAMANVLYLG